jgi:hypothetical protein
MIDVPIKWEEIGHKHTVKKEAEIRVMGSAIPSSYRRFSLSALLKMNQHFYFKFLAARLWGATFLLINAICKYLLGILWN